MARQVGIMEQGGQFGHTCPWTDVQDFGAQGDGVADDTAAIQAAVTAAPAGGIVYFPRPLVRYLIAGSIVVDKSQVLVGQGKNTTQIYQSWVDQALFDITSSDVTVKDLWGRGPGASRNINLASIGIKAVGVLGTELERIIVQDCRLTDWNGMGINLDFVNDFEIMGSLVSAIGYAGVQTTSCADGRVHHNRVLDIKCNIADDNGYGMAFTKQNGTIAVYPRSRRILVDHNTISGVPFWEGLDTHAGEDVIFDSNLVLDCKGGIILTHVHGDAGGDHYGSVNCTVRDNIVHWTLEDGNAVSGIWAGGDNAVYPTSGIITGNIVIGHGNRTLNPITTSPTGGGIASYKTDGLIVTNNRVVRCSPVGILWDNSSLGFTCMGNTIIDPWALSTEVNWCWGIFVTGVGPVFSKGNITDNQILRRGFAIANGVYINGARGVGIWVTDSPGMDVLVGPHYSEANLILSDAGYRVKMYNNGQHKIYWLPGAPGAGDWIIGDVCWHSDAASGEPLGWYCTAAGSPGTWKAMANLA